MKEIEKKERINSGINPSLLKINSPGELSVFAENIINTIREPLLALDQDLRVVKASRSFYDFFKVTSEVTIGTLIYDLGNHQWNIPKLRELLETILPEKTTFDNYEVEHEFSTIGKRIMLLNARQIKRAFGKEKVILLAIEDITERKGTEAGLEKTRKELAAIKESADELSEFAENIINTIREPLLALDQDLRVVKASRSFYDFFKVTSDVTIGTLIYDLGNHQWNIPKLRELLETILPEKTTFDNYEVEHEFSTIGKRIMLLNARQIKRAFGKEKVILLAIEDITERKGIEAGLEKTRKELAAIKESADELSEFAENIINTISEPLLVLDQDLRVVKASRSFFDLFKVTSEETIGALIYDLGNQQWNIPKLRELLETILPEKTTFANYEVEHEFSSIGKRIMLLNARQIKRAFGKEKVILLAIEDKTEHKQDEDLLKEYKFRLESTMIATNIAWWEMNVITGNIKFNHQKALMLGYSPEQFTHYNDFMKLVHPDDYEPTMQAMRDHFVGKKDLYETDYRIRTNTGEYKWFHDKGYVTQRDVNGLPVEVCGIVIDITDKMKIESELNSHRNHLEELVKSRTEELANANDFLQKEMDKEKEFEMMLQKALDKEKELNELKSRFISTTSHEFRTPLTSILSSSGLLQRYSVRWSEDKRNEHYERIKNSVAYLVKLLDDILTISKTETEEIRYNLEMVDVNKLAEQCVKDTKAILTSKHKLKLTYSSVQKEFILDKKLMSFIFNNLLSNAVKYSPAGGTVSLVISLAENFLFINVCDEGIGIPKEEIGKIFESFYRTKNAEDFAGNGLGLAIVKRAVELHKGEINVVSELGKGTTFVVKLPIHMSS